MYSLDVQLLFHKGFVYVKFEGSKVRKTKKRYVFLDFLIWLVAPQAIPAAGGGGKLQVAIFQKLDIITFLLKKISRENIDWVKNESHRRQPLGGRTPQKRYTKWTGPLKDNMVPSCVIAISQFPNVKCFGLNRAEHIFVSVDKFRTWDLSLCKLITIHLEIEKLCCIFFTLLLHFASQVDLSKLSVWSYYFMLPLSIKITTKIWQAGESAIDIAQNSTKRYSVKLECVDAKDFLSSSRSSFRSWSSNYNNVFLACIIFYECSMTYNEIRANRLVSTYRDRLYSRKSFVVLQPSTPSQVV